MSRSTIYTDKELLQILQDLAAELLAGEQGPLFECRTVGQGKALEKLSPIQRDGFFPLPGGQEIWWFRMLITDASRAASTTASLALLN